VTRGSKGSAAAQARFVSHFLVYGGPTGREGEFAGFAKRIGRQSANTGRWWYQYDRLEATICLVR